MENETDTNFGRWADKPERADRNGSETQWNTLEDRHKKTTVWRNAALIVGLFLALGWSLVHLAG